MNCFFDGRKDNRSGAYGEQDHNEACAKRAMAKMFKELKDSNGAGSASHMKNQAMQIEGLSLAGPLLGIIARRLPRWVLQQWFWDCCSG